MNVVITSERNIMKKNNLKQIGFLTLSSLLSITLNGAPVTHTSTAATVAGAPRASHGEETVDAREKKAFQFFMKLLTCPINQVPTWKDFVDEIARLLEGNARYASLRTSLLKVRDNKGFMGKKAIADELVKHEADLPKEITEKIRSLSIIEIKNRVKTV